MREPLRTALPLILAGLGGLAGMLVAIAIWAPRIPTWSEMREVTAMGLVLGLIGVGWDGAILARFPRRVIHPGIVGPLVFVLGMAFVVALMGLMVSFLTALAK